MKRIKVDNAQETLILTGMIVSDRFLRDVQTVLDRRLFKSGYSKKIAKWCLEYWETNESAPKAHIQDIFDQKVELGELEEDDTQMIARILSRISEEYEGKSDSFNDEYILQVAERFFSTTHMKKVAQEILDMAEKDPVGARELFTDFIPRIIPRSQGYDVLRDMELTRRAFTSSRDPLFLMPGALGDMVNGDLCRGSFMALMGTAKVGKTFQLMEFAFQAVRQGCNVAFFQAGDMDDEQQARRIGIRTAGRSDQERYCKNVMLPVYDCIHNQMGDCSFKKRASEIDLDISGKDDLMAYLGKKDSKLDFVNDNNQAGYVPCQECRRRNPRDYKGSPWYEVKNFDPLTWRAAYRSNLKFAKRLGRKQLKTMAFPSDTLTVARVNSQLDLWEKEEGFVADMIVTDYSDLFKSEDNRLEFRHASNSVWKGHRKLGQTRAALVLTVTQADAGGLTAGTLDLSNFSEDKRKYDHVTSFYSLNQTPEEKVAGMMRYANLLSRDDEFDSRAVVNVMQCYPIARAHLGSFK